MSASTPPPKRPPILLTPGSRVSVHSAGPDDQALVSVGVFRGLVSIGGDNAIALELDGAAGEEKSRVRLVPVPAILAIDILEAAKPEEEKRSEPAAASGYFR
ncbi:MAG TPA: hypothetical protein VML94_05885 [Thermoplasmata archaeon]|nr:hypothetical protein [Thermoplasmata archaeon]